MQNVKNYTQGGYCMSFAGYFLKSNGKKIPLKYISPKSYKTIPDRQQDLDPYRDTDGYLRRKILPHKVTTIEFSTPYMYLADKMALQALLPSRAKLTLEFWNDETNTYQTGDFYIPDVTYNVYRVEGTDILYMPIAYQFIQY
jgi:hypothetical protein